MSDKIKNKNFTPKVPQKPNFQLWLIVAAVMVLVGLTWIQQRGAVLDITQKRFEDGQCPLSCNRRRPRG